MMLSTVNCATSCVPSFVFTNDFRLSVQTSPIQPWTQSVTVFHLELNLPEPHISFPLSKFFRRYGHRIVALAPPLCGQLHLTSPRISSSADQCKMNKQKYQVVESQSTQVRQRYMKCDTQLLYGASGPTKVNEDGSCRACDTCALQGYVQMCMRSTLCSGDRHTRETNTVTKVTEDTKSGFYTVQSLLSLSPDDSHAITSRQQSNLRLTLFQSSQ